MTANAFDLVVSWACGCERLEEIATCPSDGWESVDDGEPAMSLKMALLDGQEKGWVNHWITAITAPHSSVAYKMYQYI